MNTPQYREPWFLFLLKVMLYTVVTGATLRDFTSTLGTVAGVLGAISAATQVPWIIRTRLKPIAVFAIGLGLLFLGIGLESLLLNSESLAHAIGVENTFRVSEFVNIGLTSFGFLFCLRALALYWPVFNVLEASLLAGFFVWKLSTHRDFSLHRPRYLSDFAWDLGINPVIILLVIGALLFTGAAMMMIKTRRFLRATAQVLMILIIGLSVFLIFKDKNINMIPRDDTFGLTANDPRSLHRGQGQDSSGKNDGNQGGQDPNQEGNQGGQSQGGSGRSDPNEMPFKNSYASQNQNLPIALVQFEDDYTSPLGVYYFRQTAFSQFNGHRLVQSSEDKDIFLSLPTKGSSKVATTYYKNPEEYFYLPTKIFLLVDPTKPFGLANAVEMGRLDNPNPTFFTGAYQVYSWAPNTDLENLLKNDLRIPEWDEAKMKLYLEVPKDNRYKDLADEIIKTLKPEYRNKPFARMLAIVYYLGKNGYYSLRSDHADSQDPTASFLFGNRTGYCVHFAHAAVFLARTLGIPSRVGAGYAAPNKRREKGENLALMERDAHAWPEIYLEPFGWIVMDIPLQNFLDPPTSEPSQSLQTTLGQIAKTGKNKPPEDEVTKEEKKELEKKLAWLKHLAQYLWKGLLVLAVTGLSLCYAFKMYRLWGWNLGQHEDKIRKAYRSVLDRLLYLGTRRQFGESREEFAMRLAPQIPALEKLTWSFLQLKLGKPPLLPEKLLHELVKEIRTEIKAKKVWWKMILTIINPLSWIRIK